MLRPHHLHTGNNTLLLPYKRPKGLKHRCSGLGLAHNIVLLPQSQWRPICEPWLRQIAICLRAISAWSSCTTATRAEQHSAEDHTRMGRPDLAKKLFELFVAEAKLLQIWQQGLCLQELLAELHERKLGRPTPMSVQLPVTFMNFCAACVAALELVSANPHSAGKEHLLRVSPC